VFSALGELCWYLSGSNSTGQIVPYVKVYEAEDEDGLVWGAYGPRLVSFDGHNQVRYIIDQLTQKPTSRQAVIQLFDHEDVGGAHKDVPCTCSLQYFLRDGRLSAITYMRSNDLYLGLPHDVFCFTMLQELFARSLDAELGSYHHVVGSLHVYERHAGKVEEFLAEGLQATDWAMPRMPSGDPWPHVAHLLAVEEQLRTHPGEMSVEFSEVPYWADLERLLAVHFTRTGDTRQIAQLRQQLADRYFDNFVWDRADRWPELGA
jgi:thymidylate synthase